MTSFELDRKLRGAVIAKLEDPANGFNPTFDAIAAEAGVTPFTVNFDLATTANFFLGTFTLDTLTDETLSKLPLMAIASQQSLNLRLRKAYTFSGEASVLLQSIVTWRGENRDFETLLDAIQETYLKLFNVPDQATQSWGDGIVYDGQIGFVRSGLIGNSTDRWVRFLEATMQFHVDVV